MRMTTLRVLILGDNKVGKSAVTVRFLTKRFIGEYSSSIDHVYRSTIRQEDTMTDVEVLDTCSKTSPGIVEESRVSWADAFVVVYSICSRPSFRTARDLVHVLSKAPRAAHPSPSSPTSSSSSPPLLLLANMRDLEHRREVGVEEGHELALEYGCQYYEVSAADSALSVSIAFQAFLREARSVLQQRAASLKRRRSSLGSVSKKLGAMFGKNSGSSSAKDSGNGNGGDSEGGRRRMSLTNGHGHGHHHGSGWGGGGWGGDSEKRRTSVEIVDRKS
ncbi:ras-related and estrogen-regulated growth inhibitor-like protein isoform X2 [Babylonia areolata]|uniref:ras-related and estrogen-regulated growth inhibitor-like protein isoform X2 n=1 Tax=Babylonia areolata TaxID=304850 RepID=UPI003FD357B9